VKIISAIEDTKVIRKILDHVGVPSVAPAPKPEHTNPPEMALVGKRVAITEHHTLFD